METIRNTLPDLVLKSMQDLVQKLSTEKAL